MRSSSATTAAAWLAALALGGAARAAAPPGLADRLDSPAQATPLAATSPLTAVASSGARLVAVGPRGHVLRSDDLGGTWTQASVPVSADLTAVHLASPERGWAVGHDGVVLATEDGGHTWRRQLDGRSLAALLRARYPGCDGSGAAPPAVRTACEQGAATSLLDVWFEDERRGFAVGAFNLVLRTEDGGLSWTPWLDRTDNPRALHLYAIRAIGPEVLVAGEQGLLLRLDRARGRFTRIPARQQGSLFGLAASGRGAVAFGLGGRALRSDDAGRTWAAAETGVEGALTGGTALADGRLVLVTHGGAMLVSGDGGRTFRRAGPARAAPAAAVAAAGPDTVVVAGAAGVRRVAVP